MPTKTKYFQNCLGVFQGGGCKGLAYVGAYEEAYNRGVSFSGLVGTSAGSIIATLIAAGAEPDDLKRITANLNFQTLLANPEVITVYNPPKLPWYLKYARNEYIRKGLPFLQFLGLYSSVEIKRWLEKQLLDLLGLRTGPVTFQQLKIPLYVVTTDLRLNKTKVWNYFDDVTMDVCEAVQQSCNIPFFFQPINERFVDGGLLSNLPAYVFENKPENLFNRVLAFRFNGETNNDSIAKSLDRYLGSIVNTTIDGATDLQLGLLNNIYIIEIPTGNISATDFSKMNPTTIESLVKAGRESAATFFDDETLLPPPSLSNQFISYQSFQTYNYIIETIHESNKEIIIIDQNTKWVYTIFPTLLFWVKNGTKIEVILEKGKDGKEHGPYRRRFLMALGINVTEVDEIPFRGFLIDGYHRTDGKVVILNEGAENTTYDSRFYKGAEDYFAVKCLWDAAASLIKKPAAPQEQFQPTLAKADFYELRSNLKTISQYYSNKVQIYMKSVKVEDIRFITRFVKGYKYRQIQYLFDEYRRHGLDLFEVAKLNLMGGKYTLLTPPVIEKRGQTLKLIEGNTRIYYALKNDIKEVNCVIIEDVETPIPSIGDFGKKDLLLTDKDLRGPTRFPDFVHNDYRPIEEAVRNPQTCLI
jgi:predicted acylesterase/phospholipase RssA